MTDHKIYDLYFGFTHLDLKDTEVNFGDGIRLRTAYAKFLSPLTLVNTGSLEVVKGVVPPAYWQMSVREDEVTAELTIPADSVKELKDSFEIARIIIFLSRLRANPAIGLHVVARHPISKLISLPNDVDITVRPIEIEPRHFSLHVMHENEVIQSFDWIREHWKTALELYRTNAEFRLAVDAIDSGQFVHSTSLAIVSLWAALEGLFSPAQNELRFRVSALIAAYLRPPGVERLKFQKEVASLYDKRSAAAHGKPKHHGDDLLKTFELLRTVLMTMIQRGEVPTKDQLEVSLFGA